MDALDTDTLRELQIYVAKCLNRALPPGAASYATPGRANAITAPVAAPRPPAPAPAPAPAPVAPRADPLQGTIERSSYLQRNMAAIANAGQGVPAPAPRPAPAPAPTYGAASFAPAPRPALAPTFDDSDDDDAPPPPPPR